MNIVVGVLKGESFNALQFPRIRRVTTLIEQ